MSNQMARRSKFANYSQFLSTSKQDSISAIPSLLPPEVVIEILLRLPVKSLLKFTCVSKSWLALISSPEFINYHLNVFVNNKDCTLHRLIMILDRRSNNNLKHCSFSSLLYNDSVIEEYFDDLDYPIGIRPLRIVGSVNGLICLRTLEDLFIWNPTIKKYKKLSSLRTLKSNSYLIYGFGYGFGYDEVHDDYKVVGIYQHGLSSIVEAKIYSLKSDSWRNMDDDVEDGERFGRLSHYLNGKLHWTSGNLVKNSCRGPWNIVSIDMADEKWGKVEPPCFGEEDVCCKLGVLGNNLSVICNTTFLSSVNVWVMKEYGVKESWTKMSINCVNDIERFFIFPCCYMSNKGEILIVSGAPVKRHNRDDAPFGIRKIYNNPNDDSIRYAEVTNFFAKLLKETYVESLVCPLSQNQQGSTDEL